MFNNYHLYININTSYNNNVSYIKIFVIDMGEHLILCRNFIGR